MQNLKSLKTIKLNANIIKILQIILLSLPLAIFSLGWFNSIFQFVTICCLVTLFICQVYKQIRGNSSVKCKGNVEVQIYLILFVIIASFIWIYFSGIGGFSRQVDDYWVRNPIYNDLIQLDWPVIYDLQKQPESVQNILGTDKVYMVYYLMFWIVPSFISKILGQTSGYTIVSNQILFIWSYITLLLIMFNLIIWYKNSINSKGKQDIKTAIVLIIFMFFGGLDIIFNIGGNVDILESWASGLRYVGNTQQLYWTFNQQLPVWLICQLLINSRTEDIAADLWVYSLVVWYSPWAQIGLVPLVIIRLIENPKNLVEILKINLNKAIIGLNILYILLEAIISIQYYSQNSGNMSCAYFIFNSYQIIQNLQMLTIYLIFILLEVGFMLIFMRGQKCYECYNSSKIQYITVVVQLLLIPMFHVSINNDFCMRVSIPQLFYLSLYWSLFIVDKAVQRKRSTKVLIAVILLLQLYGQFKMMTTNIVANVRGVDNSKILYVGESFQNMKVDSTEESLRIVDQQFFSHNFEDKFYYKKISKHTK